MTTAPANLSGLSVTDGVQLGGAKLTNLTI
jgi:hypothetical protein